jgi:hypothetical protein
VLHDVVEGYVSREQALDVYGVVLVGDGADERGLVVDAEATAARRGGAAAG